MSTRRRGAGTRNLPLLLALAGLAAALRWPGSVVASLPLLFCPGWGLLRCLSVLDRNFGVLGSALALSPLVLGVVTQLSAADVLPTERLGPNVHLVSIALCVAGRIRMAFYDRWNARQPPHPAPMPWWPARTPACLAVLAVTLGLALHGEPLSSVSTDSERLAVANRAVAWGASVAESPLQAGEPLSRGTLMAAATAGLAAAAGDHELRSVGLLSLAALVACLLLLAEGISRLWGNRGGTRAMLAFLLGLNPLAALFVLGTPESAPLSERLGAADFDPDITTALMPFLDGSPMALTLAYVSLLLFATLSVLRRASTHVPRVALAATAGLVLTDVRAAVLLLPGWLLGLKLAQIACRDSADNQPHPATGTTGRRAGEPLILRAPFWRPALHIGVGALTLLLVPWPEMSWGWSRVAVWGLLAAVGPGCLLFMPGIRHLNASPGREAYFFVGLVVVTGLLGALLHHPGDQGGLVVRLLACVLAVPAANGAMKIVEVHGARALVLLATITLVALPGPLVAWQHVASRERPIWVEAQGATRTTLLAPSAAAALETVALAAPRSAVLALGLPLQGRAVRAAQLLARRNLLVRPDDPDTPRARDLASLADAGGPTLGRLRGTPGLVGRELWAVHEGEPWPGFEPVASRDGIRIERARAPDLVLVSVASLRADRIDAEHMPALARLADTGLVFETTVTPFPATQPGLTSLHSGLSPYDHGVRTESARPASAPPTMAQQLAARGYRTVAVVALRPESTGLLAGFEEVHADRHGDADTLVDRALERLGRADPRPLFLWLHLEDLELPYELPAEARSEATGPHDFPRDQRDLDSTRLGVAAFPPTPRKQRMFTSTREVDVATGLAQYDALARVVDGALQRLSASLPEQDLLVVTAPHGTSLDEHEAWFDHGRDLFEPSIRVPLIVRGGGMPNRRDGRLTSLEDVAGLLLQGELPDRRRVFLESDWRPGLGTGRAYPPAVDPSSRGAAPRIWGERTLRHKTLLTSEAAPGREAAGMAFDLVQDPDEMRGYPADPFSLRRIDTARRRAPEPPAGDG